MLEQPFPAADQGVMLCSEAGWSLMWPDAASDSQSLSLQNRLSQITNSLKLALDGSFVEEKDYISGGNTTTFGCVKSCERRCRPHGKCDYGQCLCNPGYYGDSCEKRGCATSMPAVPFATLFDP